MTCDFRTCGILLTARPDMESERLEVEKQFHSRNYLLEMPRFHAKMPLKSVPQKLNFLMAKVIYQNVIHYIVALFPLSKMSDIREV